MTVIHTDLQNHAYSVSESLGMKVNETDVALGISWISGI